MKRRSRELVVVVGQPRAMLLLFKQAMDREMGDAAVFGFRETA